MSIRAALNLKRGGERDFYMCSLSSRYLLFLNIIFTTKLMEVEIREAN